MKALKGSTLKTQLKIDLLPPYNSSYHHHIMLGEIPETGFSITYLWKVAMGSSTCTLEHTKLAC